MRCLRLPSLLLAMALPACSGDGARVAVEDLGGADLRVVIARTAMTSEVTALLANEPYRFRAEPLGEVFDRGDQLQVYVLAFAAADLRAQFPGLADLGVEALVRRLSPELGAPGPGRYAPPTPLRALSAVVDANSANDVTYQTLDWTTASDDPDLAFGFRVEGNVACPPVGVPFRAFVRDAPEQVCVFERNASCEWSRTATGVCPNLEALFGAGLPANISIVQAPSGQLDLVPDFASCDPVPARTDGAIRGESRAWRCAGRIVAVQETPLLPNGAPWIPGPAVEQSDSTFAQSGFVAPSGPGIFFGVEGGGDPRLRRITISGQQGNLQFVQHPVVDIPETDARTVSSADGITVTVSGGVFGDSVGAAADQCLRLVAGTGQRQVAAAFLSARRGPDLIELMPPGVGAFNPTRAWHMVGDPGQNFLTSPVLAEVRLPEDIGTLLRLSSRTEVNPVTLVVHASNRSFHFSQVLRFPNNPNFFSCALELERPANLVGDIIAGRVGYYALVADGVRRIDASGAVAAHFSSQGTTFGTAHRITRVANTAGADRIIVYSPSVGAIHVFDAENGALRSHTVDGTIMAFVEGPRVLYRPRGQSFELAYADVSADSVTDTITYVVPALTETSPGAIEVDAEAFAKIEGRQVIGFSSGTWVGMLDLRSGRSSAIKLEDAARVRGVFLDDGSSELWALVEPAGTAPRIQLIRFPTLRGL